MLRHVLCVLVLALCCCTSMCAAGAALAPEGTAELQLGNGAAKVTLTRTVDKSKCTPSSTQAAGETKDVTISTTFTFKKKVESEEAKVITNGPSTVVTVPDGSSVALTTSLVFECTKQGGAGSNTATNCSEVTATNSITYDVSVKSTASSQATVNLPEPPSHEVKVPTGYDVKIVENVVATCAPPTTAGPTLPSSRSLSSGGQQGTSSTNTNGKDISQTLQHSPAEDNTAEQDSDKLALEAKTPSGKSDTPLSSTSTDSANPNDEVTDGERSNAARKDLSTPTSSEAESTETDSSVTVNGADHTASTATPQSETTAEGASNTDAGTPTSAGEGVKPPGRNSDASSSSTAWMRVPLILLLFACVAV
ncbi:hypothetical protein DQ04_21471000 [Trypanosoma grayi]|uniref:hypothetical protein n=1 Tax=Trypanosoma grayi TaxID=71804 RepID=UPI0004F4354C|nr:hypothetical protein DQ04_21471000 [Trypanosoma grayi]KEG05484.1 hypothetical protein DQ04_21471000 [Trypanosoma grayi]